MPSRRRHGDLGQHCRAGDEHDEHRIARAAGPDDRFALRLVPDPPNGQLDLACRDLRQREPPALVRLHDLAQRERTDLGPGQGCAGGRVDDDAQECAGALGGEALGDPGSLGLDGAFAALFLALLVLQINSRRGLAAALLGGTIAFVLVPFTAPGVPIIAATAGCLVGWRAR